MFDLQVLALQGDVTRVITFQLARETSNRTYPEIGVPDPHHPLSHHGNDPAKIARMAKINTFHVSLFAEFLAKLKATTEGNGTLLDHSLYLYGSGMGNPNVHDHINLPILVAGGAAGGMKGGRHIRFAKPTPLANLHLTLLDKVGVRLDKFADSSGKVDELFEPSEHRMHESDDTADFRFVSAIVLCVAALGYRACSRGGRPARRRRREGRLAARPGSRQETAPTRTPPRSTA